MEVFLIGKYVYHPKLEYIGQVEGKTLLGHEKPISYEYYRVRLADGSIRVASPINLVELGDPVLMRELHRKLLAKAKVEYQGVRESVKAQSIQRHAHCWLCKKHLDTGVDVECVACSWMLCHCGACGCTYADRYYS